MGKNAKRKQDTITIKCVANIVYENIAMVLELDPKNNYQKRKQISLQKLKRVYSKLSPEKKTKYITVDCLNNIKMVLEDNLPEFKLQYIAPTTTDAERDKLRNLIINWKKIRNISFLEIAKFLESKDTPRTE